MSGGSFNYLFQRAPDELREIASRIDDMAAALEAEGLPLVAARTRLVIAQILVAEADAVALADVWHAKEWKDSGDQGRSFLRRAAVEAGEILPLCPHAERRVHVGYDRQRRDGRWNECEECGEQFDFKPRGSW